MRWSLLLGAATVVTGLGCAQDRFVPLGDSVPEAVAWFALIFGPDNDFSGTELRPVTSALQTEIEDDRIRVVGYSDDQLDTVDPNGKARVGGPIEKPLPCHPRLPDPVWVASVEGETLTEETEAPPLTARWLRTLRCGGPVNAVVSCNGVVSSCSAPRPDAADPCLLDLAACRQVEEMTVRTNGRGKVCGLALPSTCTPQPPYAPGNLGAIECVQPPDRCRTELFGPIEPALEIERVIHPLEETFPQAFAEVGSNWVGRYARRAGYLSDFVVLNDRIIIAGHPAGEAGPGWNCEDPRPVPLYLFALDGNAIGTATAPPCLLVMGESLSADGFVAAHEAGLFMRFSWFDADGHRLRSTELPGMTDTVSEIVPLPEMNAHAVVRTGSGTHSLVTVLESGAVSEPIPLHPTPDDASVSDTGTTLFVLSADSAVRVVNLSDSEVGAPNQIGRTGASLDESSILYHPESGSLVVAVTTPLVLQGVYVQGPDRRWAQMEELEGATEIAPLPESPELVLVGSMSRAQEALLFLVEPRTPRIVFEPTPIGFGPVRRIRTTHSGSVWALLGWSGELVEVAIPKHE